jgi:Zn-dependent M28 family amino/carboxypeptidase
VTVEGIREHQAALQAIADANGGDRQDGTPGEADSAAYIADRLTAAGWIVTVQAFQHPVFRRLGPSTLEEISPVATVYSEGTDYALFAESEPGDVTGFVTAVDLELGLGNFSTSGCEPADFAGFPPGDIALIQRGACTFQLKVENAAAAGAVGAIMMKQGNTPERTGLLLNVTLSSGYSGGIPAVTTSYDRGVE